MSVFLLARYTLDMPDVNIGGNWLKGVWGLSVLFLTIICAPIISKS